jgi:precorrin-8X/cobalt-precorrin-8 methylmutase
MIIENIAPMDIEKRSMEIILSELGSCDLSGAELSILLRTIHTSADFDYAKNLYISKDAVDSAVMAVKNGCVIITDTQMARSGINKAILGKFGADARCFIADEDVRHEAQERGVTRASISMERAKNIESPIIFAIGNAPTALIKICEMIAAGEISPALVIGAPVGFVNVVESKELLLTQNVPMIVPRGRKGGSNIAAAIVNALLYEITGGERD